MMNLFENLQKLNEGWKELTHRELKGFNTKLYMNGYFDKNNTNKYVIRIYIYKTRKTKTPKVKVDVYRYYIIPKNNVQLNNSYFVKLDNATRINEIFNIIDEMKKDKTIDIKEVINNPAVITSYK